ncbi:DnaJ domain containing protein [Entamoeba marina]
MEDDYFAILGVTPSTSMKTVKQRYYALAKQHHPDRNPNSTQFDKIAEAYSVLNDPHKRILYNLYGKSAVNVADYISIPLTRTPLPKFTRISIIILFFITITIEYTIGLPLLSIILFLIHLIMLKQIAWRTILVIICMVGIYGIIQYFYSFDTTEVDHSIAFAEIILLVNEGKIVTWDTSIIIWILLSSISFIYKIQTPILIGPLNIGIGLIVVISTFIRICFTEKNGSRLFKNAFKVIVAMPDLQYGLLVLLAFWFFHGLFDSLTGLSLEYITICIQFLPLNKKPISFFVLFVTALLTAVIYIYSPRFIVLLTSSIVEHLLITAICVRTAGPAVKDALNHKFPRKIRLSGHFQLDECSSVGPTQMTLKELCMDVSLRHPIEWEIEKNTSRRNALLLISAFTFGMELLFSGVNGSMIFMRSLTTSYGICVAIFGFGEMMEMHNT